MTEAQTTQEDLSRLQAGAPADAERVAAQKDLALCDAAPAVGEDDARDVEWFVGWLGANPGWHTAEKVLQFVGKVPVTEDGKRWVRHLCDRSGGRVVGFSKGYRLTRQMTREEYEHWRNATLQATRSVKERVAKTDLIFGWEWKG